MPVLIPSLLEPRLPGAPMYADWTQTQHISKTGSDSKGRVDTLTDLHMLSAFYELQTV